MLVALPPSLLADDGEAAMLHVRAGIVSVNRTAVASSSALFADNLVETAKDSVATIDVSGSTATVQPETMLQYEGNVLNLDHGSLSVNTSRGLKVRVDCVTVVPVTNDWTQYTVVNVDGNVTVSALKNDVYLEVRSSKRTQLEDEKHSDRVIVHEGEQKTREEKCGAAATMPVHGVKAIFSTWEAKTIGTIAVGVITCEGLCPGSDPISPNKP